eukprot:6021756-Pyramimonas_sp.AAC.3
MFESQYSKHATRALLSCNEHTSANTHRCTYLIDREIHNCRSSLVAVVFSREGSESDRGRCGSEAVVR